MNQENAINAIKFLGVDMINKAKSGHPGIVLGASPICYTLFTRHINMDIDSPKWANRDRFILSAGHGSAMLYAILHLAGVIDLDEIKQFRQLGSLTPGHPEYGYTPCVDMTTGPLGQGISTSVGMAIAEEYLAKRFNTKEFEVFNNYTYVLCGDGDLQEGVSQEAISLAGHLKLNKLIVLYDSNDVQLDGMVSMANSENTKMKMEAMSWNYLRVNDGTNVEEIDEAINKAKKSLKPTLIEVKTVIGAGAVSEGTCKVHGSPIGLEEANNLRLKLNWPYKEFEIPEDIYNFYQENITLRGKLVHQNWENGLKHYLETCENKDELIRFLNGDTLDVQLDLYDKTTLKATRDIASETVSKLSKANHLMIGGAADLTRSAMVHGEDGNFSSQNRLGRNICYGVREHAMGAITNGLALYGLKSFCAGFFVFSDYLKPAIRMSALMHLPVTYFFSHDSIAVGEDGPTHQPIEQLSCLRTIPSLNVMRPCDPNETLFATKWAYNAQRIPSVIVTSRQKLAVLDGTCEEGFNKGAYIISQEKCALDGILLACGSEVELAIKAQNMLEEEGIYTRVVSMPSMFLFEQNNEAYKEEILPSGVKTLAIEMGSSALWYKYTRNVMGIDSFGISAPMNVVLEKFGFNKENVVKNYKKIK